LHSVKNYILLFENISHPLLEGVLVLVYMGVKVTPSTSANVTNQACQTGGPISCLMRPAVNYLK